LLHQTEQVYLNPALLHLAAHLAVELHAGERYMLAGQREAGALMDWRGARADA
jgi:hypothetical protein